MEVEKEQKEASVTDHQTGSDLEVHADVLHSWVMFALKDTMFETAQKTLVGGARKEQNIELFLHEYVLLTFLRGELFTPSTLRTTGIQKHNVSNWINWHLLSSGNVTTGVHVDGEDDGSAEDDDSAEDDGSAEDDVYSPEIPEILGESKEAQCMRLFMSTKFCLLTSAEALCVDKDKLLVAAVYALVTSKVCHTLYGYDVWDYIELISGPEALNVLPWAHIVASTGHDSIEERWQKYTAGHLDFVDTTELSRACARGFDTSVQALLEMGLDACKPDRVTRGGRTALMLACKSCNVEAVKLLLALGPEACNMAHVDVKGRTALMYACESEIPEIVTRLLKFGSEACKLDHVDSDGFTALMHACLRDRNECIIKALLEFGLEPCKVNYVNARGNSALKNACYSESINTVEALLTCGADPSVIHEGEHFENHPCFWMVYGANVYHKAHQQH